MRSEYSNFKNDILLEAGGEAILAVVITEESPGRYFYDEEDIKKIPKELVGVPLQWSQAASLLDYQYYAGFGAMDCHNIFAWTLTRVLYIHEYDGSTEVMSVPRNPENYNVS